MATTTKVYAPNEGYAGRVGDITFEKGVADVPTDHPSMGYFKRKGYGIGSKAKSPVLPYDKMEPTKDGEVVDARDYAESTTFGSPLRDAAVDPHPDDYLAPTNAGKANPHGPKVVSPGLHGVEPKPIRPGEVHVDDAAAQDKAETALAESVLVDGDPATSVATEMHADENMGPLGLSDPGSVEMGKEAAKAQKPAPAKRSTASAPKRSARSKAK